VLTLPSLAWADCVAPDVTVRWSYPDESTQSVPPNAVFWAVAHAGSVSVQVDGVPLASRGVGNVERHQFVSAAPLAEGQHELLIQVVREIVLAVGDVREERDERRVPFRVAAQAAPAEAVGIDSVTVYPISVVSTAEYDAECSELATPLEWSCDDLLSPYVTRVGYSVEGGAVAHLVQGDTLLPAGCTSFWTRGDPNSAPATFRTAALLPTGLTVETEFAGPVELRTQHPDANTESCALALGPRSPNALGAAMGLALAAWWTRRRRSR
jgi:hypothetical protein